MSDYRGILEAEPKDWIEFAGIDYQVVNISESFPDPTHKGCHSVQLTLDHDGAEIQVTLDHAYIIKFLSPKGY